MGVLADAVSQVIELAAMKSKRLRRSARASRLNTCWAWGAMGKKFCLILDIDKVLSADEILAVTEVSPTSNLRKKRHPRPAQESRFGAGA